MMVGEEVTVMKSSNPSLEGLKGQVALETANTLLIVTGAKRVTVAKAGSVLLLSRSGSVVDGNEIKGRLEDRLGARKK